MRFLIVLLTFVFVSAENAVAQAPITAEAFLDKSGLNVDQQALLAGEIISAGRDGLEINTSIDVAMLVFISAPLPVTWGLGSAIPITTRLIPAARIAWVQGGVRPVWLQGSRVT